MHGRRGEAIRPLAIVPAVLAWACACSTPSAMRTPPAEHRWVNDVVSPQETILGRVDDGGTIRLLTSRHRIIAIDPGARRATPVRLRGIDESETLGGFGRQSDGSLWTLSGWTTLVRIGEDGGVAERRRLVHPQAGVHTGFGHLVYQPLDFTRGSAALVVLPSNEATVPVPWGTFRVRGGDEPDALRLARSMTSCGVAVAGHIPCWQADSAIVELMSADGTATQIAIPGLRPWASRDADAFARQPHKAIRDVWLGPSLSMWLLVRPAATDLPDRAGERGLWHVNDRGDVVARYVMRSRARIILGVERGRVVVLTAEGHVVSVEV